MKIGKGGRKVKQESRAPKNVPLSPNELTGLPAPGTVCEELRLAGSIHDEVIMLSYDDAFQLLSRYGKDAAWIRHCIAVSRVASRVAEVLAPRCVLDADYLTTGALLHDIGRYKTHDPVLHGVEGYLLLTSLGHHREAFICASHVLCGMAGPEAARYGLPLRDFLPTTIEERLIPVIDGLVEFDRPTTFEKRCESISRRYRENESFLARFSVAAETGRRFLEDFDAEYGISLERIAAEVLGDSGAPEAGGRPIAFEGKEHSGEG